jgi:hypothetical protein
MFFSELDFHHGLLAHETHKIAVRRLARISSASIKQNTSVPQLSILKPGIARTSTHNFVPASNLN